MEHYSISQTPGGKKSTSKKNKAKLPQKRQSVSINPQFILLPIVLIMAAILGGLVYAHFIKKPATGPTTPTSAKTISTHGAIPGATFTAVTTAISTKTSADLGRFYAPHVHIILTRSKLNKTVSAGDAQGVIANPLNSAQTPWDWHVPAGDIAAWQQGPYGQYFTGNVLVGESSDGQVISIGFDSSGQITAIFVAPVGDLTGATTPSGSTNSGSGSTTPPAGTTTPPTSTPTTPDGSRQGAD